MTRSLLFVFCLAAFSHAAGPARVQAPPPEGLKLVAVPGLKGYLAPEGFKAEVAREKLGEAEAFAFADDGAIYVLTPAGPLAAATRTLKYKDGTSRRLSLLQPGKEGQLLGFRMGDAGKWAPSHHVISASHAGGLLPLKDTVLITDRGVVVEVNRRKPPPRGKVFWTRRNLIEGLGGARIHLAEGPDGWVYIAASAGDHHAQGSDGSRATALRTGAVFRCRPDGSRLHVFATGLHQPGRPAFDLAGNLFLLDGGIPLGGKFTEARLLHVVEAGDYGFRLAPGEMYSVPDPARACWSGEELGTLGALYNVRTGPSAPLCFYHDARLPEAYRGLLYHPDPRGHRLRAYKPAEDNSVFTVEEEFDLLATKDEAFQPVQAATGPDGAIYVLDRGNGGRLLRLSWAGTKEEKALELRPLDSWAKTIKLADADLVKALFEEDLSVRDVARRELARRGDKNRAELLKAFLSGKTPLASQVSALGALQAMVDDTTLKAMRFMVENGDAELRVLSATLLSLCSKEGDKEAHNSLLVALADDSPAVKRSVALAMARVKGPASGDNIASALSFDNEKRRALTLGLVAALDRLGKPGVAALVALADSGSQKDIDKVADLYRALRSPEALAGLPALLPNPHFTASQRAALVRSAARHSANLDALAARVIDDKKEAAAVRAALLRALSAPGVKAGKKAAEWAAARVTDEDRAVRLAAIGAVGNLAPVTGEDKLLARLKERELADDEKAALARALGAYKGDKVAEALVGLLAEKDARVQYAALLALAPEKAAPTARKLLASGDDEAQRAAVTSLARSPSVARELAGLALKGKLPKAALPELAVALRRHAIKDAGCAIVLGRLTR